METFAVIIAIILGLIGIIGSIVPAIPGPPLSWIGLLVMYLWGGTNGNGETMSSTLLLVWLGITTAVTVIDYIVPAYLTKLTGGSKYAAWGAMIGLLVGMFVPPVGIILGTILGAFIAEIVFAGKDVWTSAKSSMGALLGFLLGTGLKLMAAGFMLYYIFVYI